MGRWANSILDTNLQFLNCHYCGNQIQDKTWFKIKRMNGHVFAFCSKVCEKIWDKKTGYGRRP